MKMKIIIRIFIMRKSSKKKEAILQVVRSSPNHPSAESIYQQLKKEIPELGLATVYRNLRLLKENGQICELHGGNGTARYDGNTISHNHFYCDKCGKILDLSEPLDQLLENQINSHTGLKVTRRHIELGGLCPDCQ
jgi:Fur family transcriptional regulator, peroxide stress response regulator